MLANLRARTCHPLAKGGLAVLIRCGEFVGMDAEADPVDGRSGIPRFCGGRGFEAEVPGSGARSLQVRPIHGPDRFRGHRMREDTRPSLLGLATLERAIAVAGTPSAEREEPEGSRRTWKPR